MPFLALQDERYPHLVFINDQQPYPWTAGFLYSLWLRSALLRVNVRGVQAVSGTPVSSVLEAGHWHPAQCLPTANALCNFTAGTTNMLLFPTGVVDVPDNFFSLTTNGHAFLQHFNNSSPCVYAGSGREIVTGDTRYEVSLCDLLNANLDFVLTKDRAFWRQDTTTTAEYVLFSVLGIVLVSHLTSNIMNLLHRGSVPQAEHKQASREQEEQHGLSARAYAALYALFLLATGLFLVVRTWTHTTHFVLTRQDRAVAFALSLFTCTQYAQHYTAVLWSGVNVMRTWSARNDAEQESSYPLLQPAPDERDACSAAPDDDYTDRSFSLLIALLLMLVLQVYFTTDTPYSTLMVTLFLARSMHKLLQRPCAPPKTAYADTAPSGVLLSAFAVYTKLLDIFTAVLLLRGLALVQPDAVQKLLHVLSVVVVALLLSMSMLRLEAAMHPGGSLATHAK